jgi:hypothetical protein
MIMNSNYERIQKETVMAKFEGSPYNHDIFLGGECSHQNLRIGGTLAQFRTMRLPNISVGRYVSFLGYFLVI